MHSKKRGRLALLAVLSLALSATVGMVGAADAAKKKKKKGSNAAAITKSNIPIADRGVGAPQAAVTPVTFAVPKSFGKKQVGNVDVTLQVTGSGPDYLDDLNARLVSPGGRRVALDIPASGLAPNQSFGPLRYTANTQNEFCFAMVPPCDDPDDNLGPPFAGAIRHNALIDFDGVKMKGTWTLKLLDFDDTLTGVLNTAKLEIRAAKPPPV